MVNKVYIIKSLLLAILCLVSSVLYILFMILGYVKVNLSLEGVGWGLLGYFLTLILVILDQIMNIKEGMDSSFIDKVLINEEGMKIYDFLHNRLLNSCEWDKIADISIIEYRISKLKILKSIYLDLKQAEVGVEVEYNKNLMKKVLQNTHFNEKKIGKIKYKYKRKQGFVKI